MIVRGRTVTTTFRDIHDDDNDNDNKNINVVNDDDKHTLSAATASATWNRSQKPKKRRRPHQTQESLAPAPLPPPNSHQHSRYHHNPFLRDKTTFAQRPAQFHQCSTAVMSGRGGPNQLSQLFRQVPVTIRRRQSIPLSSQDLSQHPPNDDFDRTGQRRRQNKENTAPRQTTFPAPMSVTVSSSTHGSCFQKTTTTTTTSLVAEAMEAIQRRNERRRQQQQQQQQQQPQQM